MVVVSQKAFHFGGFLIEQFAQTVPTGQSEPKYSPAERFVGIRQVLSIKSRAVHLSFMKFWPP